MILSEALEDKHIGFISLFNSLKERGIGDWDNVNNTETIKVFIKDKISKGIDASSTLEALENSESTYDIWKIWLGSSLEIPVPINNKNELVEALGLGKEDLEQEIYF